MERLLESSTKYLEETLKLKVNRERVGQSACSQSENLSSLAFVLGRTEKEFISVSNGKSWKKAKEKLRQLTSRSKCGSIIQAMEKIKDIHERGVKLLRNSGHNVCY